MFGPQAHARQALFAVTVAPVSGRRVGINFRPGVCSAVRSGVLLVGMRRVGSVVSFFLRAVVMRCVPMFLVCRLCILIQHFATLEVEFGLCCSVAHFVFVI